MSNRDEKGRFVKGHLSGMTGKYHVKETRVKISQGNKQFRKEHPEFQRGGETHPNYGKYHSEKTKQKLSQIKKAWYEAYPNAASGKNNPSWKGGQKADGCGYVLIWKPDHPRAMKSGYVRRAHLVAEKKLGRYLYPEEITHHENEIKNDDRSENVKAMTMGKHTSLHAKIRRLK